MRHRIKKIPTLSNLNHLLHSDESTYFYKSKLGKAKNILYSPGFPLLGGAVLLLVLGMLICPSSRIDGEYKVYADSIIPCSPGAKDLSLTLLDSDTTSLSTEVTANEVGYISQSFQIRTCGYDNYALSAQAAPDYTGRLQGQDNTTEFIEGVGSEVLPTDFLSNQWGYAIADNTSAENSSLKYNTLPESDATTAPAYSEQEMVAGKYFKIVFAAKIGNDKPADHYGTQVLLSLVAGAGEVTKTWDTIEYMQDMTSNICKSATVGDTKQLIDTRTNNDGKTRTYWVAKLADENCWMTQNLDLDLNSETNLTPSDSDVTSNWNPEQTTITGTLSTSVWPMPENPSSPTTAEANIIRSYDAGEYVYTNPTTSKSCNAGTDGLAGGTCAADGWVNVSGMTASSDPNFGTEVVNNTYNAHYLAGNRYSWVAAKAGSTNTTPDSSICPKGWTLPKSGSSNNEKDGSFHKLIATSYGIQNAANEYKKIAVPPLYFLLSGYVYTGSLQGAGSQGWYWSSTANSATSAYYLYFTSSSVTPSSGNARYYGGSVRCVAR